MEAPGKDDAREGAREEQTVAARQRGRLERKDAAAARPDLARWLNPSGRGAPETDVSAVAGRGEQGRGTELRRSESEDRAAVVSGAAGGVCESKQHSSALSIRGHSRA